MGFDDNFSYKKHNEQFENDLDLDWHKQRFAEYEQGGIYEKIGYKKFIDSHLEVRDTHIDIGSGAGWLLLKTAPIFRRVIGIEPSSRGVGYAKVLTKDFPNIDHINAGMTEGFSQLKLENPALITTATVFSHIGDKMVSDFLKLLAKVPRGSIIFFGEPYGKNHQQFTWHIRSKEWWAEQLPDWEITFGDYAGNGYLNNISGVCVGRENVKNTYHMKCGERVIWHLSGMPSRIKYLGRIVLKNFS